jgi:hypothetical protein
MRPSQEIQGGQRNKSRKACCDYKGKQHYLAVNNHHVLDKEVLTIVEKNEEDALQKKRES